MESRENNSWLRQSRALNEEYTAVQSGAFRSLIQGAGPADLAAAVRMRWCAHAYMMGRARPDLLV